MIWLWVGFTVFIVLMLALDLGVFHGKAHVVGFREAMFWSGVWIFLSLAFTVLVYFVYEKQWMGIGAGQDISGGREAAVLYLTGYLVEYSLSLDNIFVIATIFSFFAVPSAYQHRVLFWGILSAMVLRAAMIAGGSALIHRFHWILYVFGAFLIFSAVRMLTARHEGDLRTNPVVRFTRRLLPVTEDYHGQRFFVRIDGRTTLTPLAMALIMVEAADIVFALDSIPAIFAITDIPFLVFTSNIFAIMGLRSLYFALANLLHRLRYLKISLALLLAVVGVKMLLKDILHLLPGKTYWILGVIVVILLGGIIASLLHPLHRPSEPERKR
jgi:tellurite resistance protein TerC